MAGAWALLVLMALTAGALRCEAQDLEPRAYSNAPVGLNFLVLGYVFSHGNAVLDTAAPIEDAKVTTHSAFLGYAHVFSLLGRSSKIELALPYAWLSGSGEVVGGRSVERHVSGVGDPRIRLSTLLYGGPALSLEEFADYEPDLIIGASLALTLPLSQYDQEHVLNIGTNRWSFKPELGISKTWGPLTLELAPSVTFFTDNNDFLGGGKLHKDPLYAVQGHVVYHTRFGLWAAVDATYYGGGRATINGEHGTQPQNLRLGATLAIPINRYNSVKLYASKGAYTRVGGDFTTAGIAWQFRWGGGL